MLEFYAGVPHLKSDRAFNGALARLARRTQNRSPLPFGGFSALFDLKRLKVRDPLLVATTDGVGTKLDLARLTGTHNTIGIDLVAMSVNDLITCGARPIFFLDYFAAGAFDRKRTLEVIRGIAKGCVEAGCSLVGGETAIMPGFYADSTYDLAGFAVGVVERSRAISGDRIQAGDSLLGLESSGFHSNGFSLVRKLFTEKELSGQTGRRFLKPTQIYVKPVLNLISKVRINGIAHITGGGFYDNLPRIVPKGLSVEIDRGTWPVDPLFREVAKRARSTEREMYHTFNMGIGMVLVLSKRVVRRAQHILKRFGISSWEIGAVVKGHGVTLK
ncbi:MAG: phosphoribosylformylglycinamidine cyclo-ligase [Omnitrophica bacterium RIFCSPLOWO2_01_FULL_50_24]|nr:MAG: phosphoribosylformylglycinamidine cyclo-ligase [Omnitrophica bacterium RIFCSPLOWO2_01_FULL_50_24]